MTTPDINAPQGCIGPDHHPGMIRLPIAQLINHRIRFSPLAVAKEVHLQPAAALDLVGGLLDRGSTVRTVLLYGPGDPLADLEPTLAVIELLKRDFPELHPVLRTLGINGLRAADKLQKAGVDEVEIMLDGIDQMVLEKLYAWVRPGFRTLKLSESVAILVEEQRQAIQAFKDAGMHVRVITTCYPTANDDHIVPLARHAAELGVDEMVLHPYAPDPNADILLPAPEPELMEKLIAEISGFLPIRQGRPQAIGPLATSTLENNLPRPKADKPNVAVVSTNGMDVDLHLGQAPQLLVYGPREDGLTCLLECRPAPAPGAGKERWDMLADSIPDCFALLAASAGDRPKRILDNRGIRVIVTRENIEGTVDVLYGGGKKKKQHARSAG